MSKQYNNTPEMAISYTSLGLAVGLVFGGLIGLLIDNMLIFAGGGMVVGLAVGSALDKSKNENIP